MTQPVDFLNPKYSVFLEVLQERTAQDKQWGEQNHNLVEWIAILTEEIGETSQQAVDFHFSNPVKYIDHKLAEPKKMTRPAENPDQKERLENYRKELIQVAAVAIQMIESVDRNEFNLKCD
jgi:hypothetical protein